MSVVYIGKDKIVQNFDASTLTNKTTKEISKIINCPANLAIHTPFCIEVLHSSEKPTELYPDLVVQKKFAKYNYPPTFLTFLNNNELSLCIRLIDNQNSGIPSFYVPFDLSKINTIEKIIGQIEQTFGDKLINPKLAFGNHNCAENKMKVKDIFERGKKENLTVICELPDSARKSIRMRQNVLAEVVSTEKTYISDLSKLNDFWKPNVESLKMLSAQEIESIFKYIPAMINCQQTFLANFEASGINFKAECANVFIEFSSFFKISKPFISNYPTFVQLLVEKSQSQKFNENMESLAGKVGGRDLASFLITPVQRLPRYILFLRELVKNTPKYHPDFQLLEVAYQEIDNVTRDIESASSIAEKQLELYRIHISLASRGVSILEASRVLEKHYFVKVLTETKYAESKKKGHVYIFNDLIVISQEESSSKHIALYHSSFDNCRFIRNLPSTDSVTFFGPPPSNKIATVRFESSKVRDEVLKKISLKIQIPRGAYCFKDIAMTSVPPILVNHKTVCVGSYIYAFGGDPGSNKFVQFELSSGKVSFIQPSSPLPSMYGHSICSIDDKVYILGLPSGSHSCELWCGDFKTKCFNFVLKPNFTARKYQTMCAWNDKLVVFGGKRSTSSYSNTAIFDTKSLESGCIIHNQTNNSPQPRYGHTAVVYNDSMIVYGGKSDKKVFSDLYVLNLKTFEWSCPQLSGEKLPPRAFHQSIVNDDVMISIGGDDDISTAHLINLKTFSVRSIQCLGNAPRALSSFTLDLTSEGDLVIIGGKTNNRPTNLMLTMKMHRPPPKFIRNTVRCQPSIAEDKSEIIYSEIKEEGPYASQNLHKKYLETVKSPREKFRIAITIILPIISFFMIFSDYPKYISIPLFIIVIIYTAYRAKNQLKEFINDFLHSKTQKKKTS